MSELVLGVRVLEQEVVRPEEHRVRERVGEDDRILAVGEASRAAGLASWLLRARHDGHLVVDGEHAADEEAVDDDYDDVLLGKNRVGQRLNPAVGIVPLIVDVSEC